MKLETINEQKEEKSVATNQKIKDVKTIKINYANYTKDI